MSTGLTVALISAGVAVCSAVVSAYVSARSIRLQHELALKRGNWIVKRLGKTWFGATARRSSGRHSTYMRASTTSSKRASSPGTW